MALPENPCCRVALPALGPPSAGVLAQTALRIGLAEGPDTRDPRRGD